MENKISVIVPIYNVETYLHRCIESIINQTYQNLEIILVNDGSPDNSGNICDEYAKKDDRIRVIHKENEGSSCARNAGLNITTGNYVSYVDSDDYIEPIMFESMIDKILEFDLEVVEIKAKNTTSFPNFNDTFIIQDKVSAFKRIIETTAFSVWRRMYKVSVIGDLRFIPKIIHQDVFYTIDVLNRINQIGYLNCKFYNYNVNNESIIRSKYSSHKIEIGIKATEYIIDNTPKDSVLKNAINNYITFYYTDHYFLLSRNTQFDPNYKYRKKIRQSIRSSINFNNYNLRSLMVLSLPPKIMEHISKLYKFLISLY